MRILSHKDLCSIPGKIGKYSVVLEPVDESCSEFLLHIRAVGLGGGTLHGARGEPRTFKNVNKAIKYIRDILNVNEITVLLRARNGKAEKNNEKKRSGGKRDSS